jgi:lipoyl(octanoyl) transferase
MNLVNQDLQKVQQANDLLKIQTKDLGTREYQNVWQAMVDFTEQRNSTTQDQIWSVEHPPVYTMGLAGKAEHLLNARNIPVINTDRGGQVTYHGPGQIVIYLLLDLKRRKLGIKALVKIIEDALIKLLSDYSIEAHTIDKAPGVYVDNKKIAALGLRVRANGCYHGLSLNVDMDMDPFLGINPCGYPGLKVIQLKGLDPDYNLNRKNNIQEDLIQHLLVLLNSRPVLDNE